MIHQFKPVSDNIKPSDYGSQFVSLDRRLTPEGAVDEHYSNSDELYEQLKELWQSNPAITNTEIIDCLRNFKSANGDEPYKDIRTHVSAIAQVMKKLKEEGGEETPIYATLNRSMAFAVVSEGSLISFIGKMMERPENPEPW